MKKLLILLFLFSNDVLAVKCKDHPIYCQIIKNKSKINKKYAMRLSNIIYKMHKKYRIPSRIFTAILMQESGYSLEAKSCHSGVVKKMTEEEARDACHTFDVMAFANCFRESTKMVEAKVCTDFGISQIYYKTAKRWKFNIRSLTQNLEYSVEAGAKVLHDIMKRFKDKDKDWFTRYNCGFKGTTRRDTCQIYKKLVERYM